MLIKVIYYSQYRKAEENSGLTSRNDGCYLGKHIRLLHICERASTGYYYINHLPICGH